jgi:PTS system mannose-specific IIB component
MPIVLARIDERLIHGQVMTSPALAGRRVNRIIVADAPLAENAALQKIFTSSTLSGDCDIEEVAYIRPLGLQAFLEESDSPEKRWLAIFRGLTPALEAVRAGLSITSLNLGNYTSQDPQKRALTRAFSVGPGESKILDELHAAVGRLYFNGLSARRPLYSPARHSWGGRG